MLSLCPLDQIDVAEGLALAAPEHGPDCPAEGKLCASLTFSLQSPSSKAASTPLELLTPLSPVPDTHWQELVYSSVSVFPLSSKITSKTTETLPLFVAHIVHTQ